jgi:hypothetical protein
MAITRQRPARAGAGSGKLRSLLWWALVTVLVLMVLSNLYGRAPSGSSRRTEKSIGGSPVAGESVDSRRRRLIDPVKGGARKGMANGSLSSPGDDPEDIDAGRNRRHMPGGTRDKSAKAAQLDRLKRSTLAAESEGATFVQRALLEHFLAREQARPAKHSACFVSLVRHTKEGLTRFVRLLRNVQEQLPEMSKRYPFVAFLEAHVDTQHVHDEIETLAGFPKGSKVGGKFPLGHVFPAGVILAVLDHDDFGSVPSWTPPEHQWQYGPHNYWGIPYRHMCRFFGVRIMNQKALKPFTWYMRLDTDSFLLAPVRSTVVVPARPMAWDTDYRFPLPDDLVAAAASGSASAASEETNGLPKRASSSESPYLHKLGLEEREVEVDLFHEMAVRGSIYGFLMVHPQPSAEFLAGLYDTYDAFVRKEIADHHVEPGDPSLPFRGGGTGDGDAAHNRGAGPTPFHSPRGLGLHFWDNFEIVDLRLFRPRIDELIVPMSLDGGDRAALASAPTAAAAGDDAANNDAGGAADARPAAASPARRHLDRAQSVQRFLTHFDRASGFYTHRWGDAEVRTLTATLYLEQHQLLYTAALPYQHYHNYHCPPTGHEASEQGAPAGTAPTYDTAQEPEVLFRELSSSHAVIFRSGSRGDDLAAAGTAGAAVVAQHQAADAMLRRLSPRRQRLLEAVREVCVGEARKNYGSGSKGRGTAEMRPGELQPANHFFWQQAWPTL